MTVRRSCRRDHKNGQQDDDAKILGCFLDVGRNLFGTCL